MKAQNEGTKPNPTDAKPKRKAPVSSVRCKIGRADNGRTRQDGTAIVTKARRTTRVLLEARAALMKALKFDI